MTFASALDRRRLLAGGAALALGGLVRPAFAAAPSPLLTVAPRTLEVKGKAAKVYGLTGANGKPGLFATEGDRFSGAVLNATPDPLTMHWHGQIFAPHDQDRARPGGGTLAVGASDSHDFLLTPGTHPACFASGAAYRWA